MFGFLKKKLKDAVSKFSKRVDEEVEDKAEEKAVSKEVPKPVPKEVSKPALKPIAKPVLKPVSEQVPKPAIKQPEIKPEKKELPKPEFKKEELFEEESKLKEEIKEKIEKIEEQKEKVAEGIREIGEVDDSEPEKKEELIEEVQEEIEEIKEEVKEVEEKRGFLSRIFGRKGPEKEKEEEKSQTESVTESKTLGLSKSGTLRGTSQTTFVKKEVREEKRKEGKVKEIKETIKTEEEFVKEKVKEEIEEEAEDVEEKKEEVQEEKEDVEEKKGFFQRIAQKITTKTISEDKFDDLFWDLEMALLENNVAVEVIDKIKSDLKKNIVGKPIQRSKVDETIVYSLRESIEDLFDVPQIDLIKKIKDKKDKPFVVVFVGVNGSGKTTTIAKFAKMLQDYRFSVVLGAADTFRAAAIDQLQLHANNLGVKMIKHDYGSDPAAVAFDAIKHAQASNKDAVLIDTAGRLHSNTNLMDEMKKIIRVAKPDLTIFIGESITGNDCVEQAKMFDKAAGFDAIVLSKADVDEKGGAAISISYITKKPIIYMGVGQEYGDLKKFDSKLIVESLGLA